MNTKTHLINFLPLLALPAVILAQRVGLFFSPYTTWILGALLFFSFLGLSPKDLLRTLRDPAKSIYVSLIVLIVAPLVAFPIMQRFFPDYFVGAMLFMLLPSAVSSPAVAAIYGGNLSLAAVNTVFSSLLSPLTIPVFLVLFMGSKVHVSPQAIFLQLVLVIATPFILGLIVDHYCKKTVEKTKKHYRFLNLFLLFLFFFAALAPYRTEMLTHALDGKLWLAVLIAYAILYFFSKLLTFHATDSGERIAIESNLLLLNLGLGILIAKSYFGPEEMLFLIFAEIVFVVLIPLFKYVR